MKANTHQRTQYIGTFVKASGEARTMRFTTSPEKIAGRGLITVWDVERRGLRKFNLATLVGRLTATNIWLKEEGMVDVRSRPHMVGGSC